MTALNTPPRVRFVRESAPYDLQCPYKHHISQRQRTIEAALLRCKQCGQWIYAVAPRTGEVDFLVTKVITCSVSDEEVVRIEVARLNPLEALVYLGLLDLTAVTVVQPAMSA